MTLLAGVARTRLSPWWGVELAGWGYYLERTWQHVRDHTVATALVFDDGSHSVALAAVDLMYADAAFTAQVRRLVRQHTDIHEDAVLVGCSHSHNTPTAALIRGAGEVDASYVSWAARQTATAVIQAWRSRGPASLHVGNVEVHGWSFNRTRDNGPIDPNLGLWRIDDSQGKPMAVVANYHAHPTVMMELGPADLSRDWPGQVTDIIEHELPGCLALYFQGACGDINFERKWNAPEVCDQPGQHLARVALDHLPKLDPSNDPRVTSTCHSAELPTRRWTREEIDADREEALYRQKSGDTTGWLDGFARVIVNQPDRLNERYAGDESKAVQAVSRFGVEWTDAILADLDARPETLTTEVQSIRIGDATLVSNPSELFCSLALETRERFGDRPLMVVGYANDSIGYMPDGHDIRARSYAAYQSPKFKNQFPFPEAAPKVMVEAMVGALNVTS